MSGQPESDDGAASTSVLDGRGARLVALAILLAVLALIVWLNRDAVLPAGLVSEAGRAPAGDDPVARCLAERAADIDAMLAEGTINEQQAALFTSRAEALCEAQQGRGSGPPPSQ